MTARTVLLMTLVLAIGAGCTATVAPETVAVPTATGFKATASPPATVTVALESEMEQTTETPALTSQPIATSTPGPTPGSTLQGNETMTPGREALPQVTLAREDLAQRLDLSPGAIKVLEVQHKTWPDASLGCPQPGAMYAQVLQEGLLIRLQAEGKVYNYHSGTGDPFLCDESDIPRKPTPPLDIELMTQPPPSEDE